MPVGQLDAGDQIIPAIDEGVHGSRGSDSGRAVYDDPRVAVGPLVLAES